MKIALLFLYLFTCEIHCQGLEWELKKEKAGIKVFTRPSTQSALDEYKGVIVVDQPLSKVVNLLKDADQMKEWIPNCSESRIISTTGNSQYRYSVSKAPFPISDRDSYVRSTYIEIPNGVKVEMEAVPDFRPINDDLVRVPFAEGFWKIESTSASQTKVTYQMMADPGGSIPDWMANAAAVDTPYETLKNMRVQLDK